MSYPYDYNPWDDSPAPGAGQPGGNAQQQQPPLATSNYSMATNYSVGSTSYGAPQSPQPPPFQQEAAAPAGGGADYQQSSAEAASGERPADDGQSSGFVGRFLRRHVPAVAPILDTVSKINLPFVDALVQHVNKDLLISKMFYFFFYSAFGSLFPLMGVYFKQQGMNPGQVGILTGVRPLIEIFSAPFWHNLADKFNKSKALLLFSLLSWIVFTYSLCHIRPPASGCIAFNDTDYVIYTPYSANDLSNYELDEEPNAGAIDQATGNQLMDSRNFRDSEAEVKPETLKSSQRRRRRRQVWDADQEEEEGEERGGERLKEAQYVYNVGVSPRQAPDSYTGWRSTDNELAFDPESDFEDSLLVANRLSASQALPTGSRFGRESLSPSASDNSLLPSTQRKGSRYKRAARVRKAKKQEEEEEEEQEQGAGGESETTGEAGERAAAKKGDDEEPAAEGQEGDTGGARQVEASESGEAEGGEERKLHATAKHNQQATDPTANNEPTTATSYGSQLLQQAEGAGTGGDAGAAAAGNNKTKRVYKQRHKTPPTHIVGMSPITIQYAVNYNPEKHSQSVTPMFSTIVYKLDDIKEVFFLLLLLISLGEFFSAPALTIADSVTLSYLGDNTDLYGRQRMFGSLSWAITLLLVGMALDNATSIADHPCGPHLRERSYTVCFIIFALLMACAFFTATQFRFGANKSSAGKAQNGQQSQMLTSTTGDSVVTTTAAGHQQMDGSSGNIDELYASTQPRSIFNTAPPVNAPPPGVGSQSEKKFEFLDNWKSAVFAQRTRELPQWLNVFCQFRNTQHLTYLFITWFLGCGVGLVFTFLFWHLQDVGGTPTLFGICSVINHFSEILAYFFSLNFIKRFGHTRVLSVGLGCNAIRFLYVAFLTNPYYALPFELVQGITHSTCFAACCSYMSRASKVELRNSTQGVMQGLYHGVGRACGALLGGYMINKIGSRATFCIYGLLSGCVLAGFLQVRKRCMAPEEAAKEEAGSVDQEVGQEAIGGLGAPQGVPSAVDYQW